MSLTSRHAHPPKKKLDVGFDVHHGWDSVMAFPVYAFYSLPLGAMGLVIGEVWTKANGFCLLTCLPLPMEVYAQFSVFIFTIAWKHESWWSKRISVSTRPVLTVQLATLSHVWSYQAWEPWNP